ncbi:DUF3375 domain-containing protein [Sinimarinibacterium flocculans]|uniref:Uncharacterized protein DUF3375 n=1 Tax=Sinimarinibacterium flocculans TaxID=985250 RepID=A0A318EAS1_9GAMM|nr:DUF3375 domain-containing protein [Sinimarinibacterium flocculans]PXV64303.1 uncharacterized protein DUF3375 [Sinimarinibacterium flocculans]
MSFDHATLELLRQNHPAWRLLRADHAALIASFLHRVFVVPNLRAVAQADLAEALEDELFALRERLGPEAYPKPALHYLDDWAAPDKGWLRKFYRQGTDEPQFDLTPSTEKAIAWLGTLGERSFVGTESRLLTLFELLRQISQGTETDPQTRLAELHSRRDEIDAQIASVLSGEASVLDDTAVRDRFQQFLQLARELLSDFREVEHNLRQLDRRVRERIALWQGGKGALVEDIIGERDAIADSDQGRSFRAFWGFLMSSRRQEEFSALLEHTLSLPAVEALKPEGRLRRVHYDWLEAGEHTQRTVAELSRQLRRFLDDQAWLENRRIMDIPHSIEARALALRDSALPDTVMQIADPASDIELPMERPLHAPALRPRIVAEVLAAGDDDVDAAALYAQVVVDKARLSRHVRQALQDRAQVTLCELVRQQPLQQGLAELVAYLQLGDDTFKVAVDESVDERVDWQGVGADGQACLRQARLPRVIFVR